MRARAGAFYSCTYGYYGDFFLEQGRRVYVGVDLAIVRRGTLLCVTLGGGTTTKHKFESALTPTSSSGPPPPSQYVCEREERGERRRGERRERRREERGERREKQPCRPAFHQKVRPVSESTILVSGEFGSAYRKLCPISLPLLSLSSAREDQDPFFFNKPWNFIRNLPLEAMGPPLCNVSP